MSFFDEMQWRGLVYDATPGLPEALAAGRVSGYIGFDPSAPSLHVGSLLPVMALARLQRHGHGAVALVGGGTGMVGDPSGKTRERQLLSAEAVEANSRGIRRQLDALLDVEGSDGVKVLDNAQWLHEFRLVDFLREVGKHFSVNAMLARESIKRRLAGEEGISFTEFAYVVLQAYDFLALHDRLGCTLQMGGSDQWGNILSGVSLIRRMRGAEAHGLVSPLITNRDGTKFGKTEEGTVWLDPRRTSPYHFYQFWLNTDDGDVVDYLRYFTWLKREEIDELEGLVAEEPEARAAQRRLAEAVTEQVHGLDALESALRVSSLFFGGDLEALTAAEILDVLGDAPRSELSRSRLEEGLGIVDLLVHSGLAASRGEARRSIQGGGIYLGSRRVTDPVLALSAENAVGGEIFLLRKGKKNYHLVRLTGRTDSGR